MIDLFSYLYLFTYLYTVMGDISYIISGSASLQAKVLMHVMNKVDKIPLASEDAATEGNSIDPYI